MLFIYLVNVLAFISSAIFYFTLEMAMIALNRHVFTGLFENFK